MPYQKEQRLPSQPEGGLRPADVLLQAGPKGRPQAIDVTIAHGWQSSERRDTAALELRRDATREKWRAFLVEKEAKKHSRYDVLCAADGWDFAAMAFGTWGGMGPEAAKLLQHFIAKAAAVREVDLRAARKEELRLQFQMALTRQVWHLLGAVRCLM